MKSTFSGKDIPKGTGKMYVQKDGKIVYFASRKEEKNALKLKRDPRKLKWASPRTGAKRTQTGAPASQNPGAVGKQAEKPQGAKQEKKGDNK